MASRLVQYGVSASPSIGRRAGSVPVLRTTPRAASSSDRAVGGLDAHPADAVEAAVTADDADPGLLQRLGVVVVGPVVVGLPDPGGDQRPVRADVDVAGQPGTRRASASSSAGRTISFEGVQPQNGHSPPTSARSTPTTAAPPRPACGGVLAAGAEPEHHDVDLLPGNVHAATLASIA